MYPYNIYPIFGMKIQFWCIIMVADDDNVKFADEKPKETTSERVKQFAEESEISSDYTQTDEFLQAVQKRPWLNLTLRYVLAILVVIVAFWLYLAIDSIVWPRTTNIHLVLSCNHNSGSASWFRTWFTCYNYFGNDSRNLDYTTSGTIYQSNHQ